MQERREGESGWGCEPEIADEPRLDHRPDHPDDLVGRMCPAPEPGTSPSPSDPGIEGATEIGSLRAHSRLFRGSRNPDPHAGRASYRHDHVHHGLGVLGLVARPALGLVDLGRPAAYGLLPQLYLPRSISLSEHALHSRFLLGRPEGTHLFLDKFQLLGLEKLLGHSLRASLGTQAELPQFLAERCGVLVEEAGELDL